MQQRVDGLPKVILTLAQGVWTPESSFPFLAAWAPTAQPQTILVPGPMYHTNGFSPLTYLLGGDRLVVLEKFDAATVVDAIERYRITNFTATPTMWPASRPFRMSVSGTSPASRGSCRARR